MKRLVLLQEADTELWFPVGPIRVVTLTDEEADKLSHGAHLKQVHIETTEDLSTLLEYADKWKTFIAANQAWRPYGEACKQVDTLEKFKKEDP